MKITLKNTESEESKVSVVCTLLSVVRSLSFSFSLQEGGSFTNEPDLAVQVEDCFSYADSSHLPLCGAVAVKPLVARKTLSCWPFYAQFQDPCVDSCSLAAIPPEGCVCVC